MSTDPSTPENDPNLSGLGRALLDTGGSKPSSGPWVPPTAEELHAILPQYEIVKMLGRGGMGAVYMGRQTSLERPVAIKILSAQLEESDQGFTERFKNEAKAMAKLNHPGIVSVYDFGTTSGGLLYIVMEYVDGTDVARMIAKSGRLHTEHAMAITAHVCDALAYAHERGIIHRDIKPANIMVGYDGAVKVADFGLAKVNTGGKTLGLTMSGMAMGTLHFMAPEALMLGTAVDHRADIYAVGVMLYQMLTGKLPQGMFKMPSLLVPGLDPRYDGIITKAIMEDREARYQTAREMRADLDGILTQPVVKVEVPAAQPATTLPTQARPQRPGGKPVMRQAAPVAPMQTPKTSLAWLWMTALIVGVLGVVAWLVMDTREKPVVASAPPSPADGTIPATPPAVSPPTKSPPAPDTGSSDEKLILGRWTRTNMDQPGAAYLMDLSADGTALWTGDNTTVRGTWQLKSGALEVDWSSRFKFLITPPTSSSSAVLKGTANWPDGKSTEIVYERQTTSSGEPATLVETFNGHRYQFVPGALTWKEAKAKAESMGGHLATLTSKEENEWLLLTYRKLLTTQNRNIWLGASEEMAGVGWKWVTGEPFTPLGWFPGEPNGKQGGGGQVGHPFMLNLYSFKDGAVGWNDSSTHFSQSRDNIGFIVEWDADAPSTPVASVSPLTAADDTNGWQSLFNGKDLTGWVLHPTNFPADVQNGLLRLRGSDTIPTSGNMYWRGSGTALPQFTDFEVAATLKTENKGNSGIFLHSHPGASQPNRAEGVEVQIWNDSTRGTTGHTGSLQRVAPLSSSRFRDGDWIQVKARVEGKRVQTWLKKPEETTWLPAIDWTQPDDWAAYPDRPGLRLGSGTISLQNNPPLDGVVWFKEIKFRSLDKSASQTPSVVSATTTAAPVASATLWIDTKGRSLQAKFIRVEGADVVLDIAGKATPVAMASLSAASQQIAQQLQSGVAVATSTGDDFISLLDANQPGDWVQVGPGKLDIQNGVATTSSPSKWGVAIYSKRMFADFILKAEFKGVGQLFNSGLWLRIPDLRNDIDQIASSRYEVGIVHSSGDRGRFTGSIWGIHPVRSDGLKANDWNELEVTVTGQLYVVKLNGKLVMNFNGSKSLSGYIGLEENGEPGGGPVQFRNVRIKPLP